MTTDYGKSKKRGSSDSAGKSAKGSNGGGYTPVVWRTVTFTPEQKARAKAQEFDAVKTLDILADMVEHGHKISFNPETADGFVGVSVYGHSEQCLNKGFGVSGEGGSLFSALRALCLKLDILDFDLRVEGISDAEDFR